MSSIVFLEYILQGDTNAGNFVNATEFAFVLLQSIPQRLDLTRMRFLSFRASWLSHFQHALLWVSMSIFANYVFAFNISVPVHTLFRSCNVIGSLALGWLAFGQKYTIKQIGCVLVITIGIFLCSISDAKNIVDRVSCSGAGCGSAGETSAKKVDQRVVDEYYSRWCLGVAMLVCVQLLQATLGHTQAMFYQKFRDKGTRDELADEYLFTSHIASFVGVAVLWEDIVSSARLAAATPVVATWLPIPTRLCWVGLNNIAQLLCIKGVFRMSAYYPPLTVNITLTLRKFLSLVFSIIWFRNPWTHLHSISALMVFGGVFVYSQCPRSATVEHKKME